MNLYFDLYPHNLSSNFLLDSDCTELFTFQKGGPPIHRSRSVPALNNDSSGKQLDSLGGVFRVIHTTSRGAKGTVLTTSNTSIENDNGNFNCRLF